MKKRPSTRNTPPRSRLKTFLWEHSELFLIFFFTLLVASCFGLYLFMPQHTFATKSYPDLLFSDQKVHQIEVKMPEATRTLQLAAPNAKNKYLAEAKIDGEVFSDVTISTRGNASLTESSVSETLNKYSYKLSFSRLDKNLSYHGLDKIILGSFFNDSSYLRDYLAYTIMRETGLPSPLVSFVELSINGEPQGLYLATEDLDRSFLGRNGFAPDSALFKPESALHDASTRIRYEETNNISEIAELAPEGYYLPYYHGADLVYRGDSLEEYTDIFDHAVTKYSPKDEEYIIRCIKTLTEAESVASCWDYDSLAKYFVAQNFIINRDSYLGSIAHNYYLLLSDHHLSFLPWDYNYAFLGFTVDGETLTEIPEDTSIFNPSLGVPESERPLWARLKSDPNFQEKYLKEYESLLENYINNGLLSEKLSATARLIRRHIAADPLRAVELSDFDTAVEYLENFIHARALSVQRQLWDYKKLPSEGEQEEVVSPSLDSLTLDSGYSI